MTIQDMPPADFLRIFVMCAAAAGLILAAGLGLFAQAKDESQARARRLDGQHPGE